MPKLPDATVLNNVTPNAVRSFTNIPVADYAGLGASLGQAVNNVGQGLTNYADSVYKKQQAQERFDTRLKLLDGEQAYNDRVKDLDPLDPDYVEKVKAARKETILPIVQGIQDPENQQYFAVTTKEDYVKLGQDAEVQQRAARGKQAVLQIGIYADDVMRKKASGQYSGDASADIDQMIEDNTDIDRLTKDTLKQKFRGEADAVAVDVAFQDITRNGYTLRPDVKKAIDAVEATAGTPSWMGPYLRQLAAVESSGGYKLSNDTTTAGGIYAFTDSTGKAYGLSSSEDKNDPVKATSGAVGLTLDNFKALKGVLGRDPTPGELYLAHQQGADGVGKLLANPDARAASVVGLSQVENNLPDSMKGQAGSMTAGEYAGYWTKRFSGNTPPEAQNPADTMSVIESMPEFQRLSATDQLKFKSSMLEKIETENKENEKLQKLAEARSVVDGLVATYPKPEDHDKAEKELRKSISDPDYLEKAIGMLDTEYARLDQNKKADNNALYNKTAETVAKAVADGKPDLALAAIPEGMDPADKAKLTEFVRKKGGPREDNRWVSDKLIALSVSQDPRDQEEFKSLNLGRYINDLSDETRNNLVSKQQAILNGDKKPGTTFENAQSMLNAKLREIGVNITDKSQPGDVAVKNRIVALAKRNVEDAENIKGAKLNEDEISAVFDKTFMQFRGPASKGMFWDTPGQVTSLKNVMTSFAEKEETYGKLPGQLVNEAITDLENSIEAKKFDIQRAIDSARNEKEAAGLRTRLRRLEQVRVDGSMLNEWLRRYQP